MSFSLPLAPFLSLAKAAPEPAVFPQHYNQEVDAEAEAEAEAEDGAEAEGSGVGNVGGTEMASTPRLFFCGEHTTIRDAQCVHGACLTGERAARQLAAVQKGHLRDLATVTDPMLIPSMRLAASQLCSLPFPRHSLQPRLAP